MKKSFLCFLISVWVVVFSVITPLTVLAANQASVVGVRWQDIANEYNIDLSNNYVIWIYNNQYYIATQQRADFGASLNSTSLANADKITLQLSNGSTLSGWNVYKCNAYYSPYGRYTTIPNNASNYRYDIDTLVFNNIPLTYVNDNSVTVVNSNPISYDTSNGDIVSGSIGVIGFNQVLNEVINLLPLLVPVVITFIAIRKGIKFTLRTLRSA